MKRSLLFAPLLGLVALARGGTFTDDFSSGLRPSLYTVSTTGSATFSLDATHGDVRMAKTGSNTAGSLTNEQVSLNLATFGSAVAGDFSTSLDFSNAVVSGGGLNQVELHTGFADGSIFFDVFDNSTSGNGVHVWDGSSTHGNTSTPNNGRFTIQRVGSTFTALYNGTAFYTVTGTTSNLTALNFVVQNNSGSNDPVSATFDNLSLTAQAVPEPSTVAALGFGAVVLLRRRRNHAGTDR